MLKAFWRLQKEIITLDFYQYSLVRCGAFLRQVDDLPCVVVASELGIMGASDSNQVRVLDRRAYVLLESHYI